MSIDAIAERRFLITGASSGIGAALVERLARQRARLIITARRESRLQQLASQLEGAGGQIVTIAGDITDPALRQRLIDGAADQLGGLDVVVNNAGVGAIGRFADARPDRLRTIMEVNFFAPVELIRLALPLLRHSDGGTIVNIGSVLGHRAVPSKSEYCASKFALHGFSDALRAELVDVGIRVNLISPSTTASEFFDQVLEGQAERSHSKSGMAPELVAAAIERSIRRNRHDTLLSVGGKALVWIDRLWPTMADRLVARYG